MPDHPMGGGRTTRSFAGMPTSPFTSATRPAQIRYGSGAPAGHRVRGRVLASLLVVDIVGSTQRAAELGDRRWCEVLDEYARLVERELAHHRGRLVNRAGHGVLATFDTPAQALRCAVALADAASAIGLELRAGVHTGECEARDGDVAGIAVHLAARVQAVARPGELLATSTVKDLVAGSELPFEDRGRHVLKGIPGEWALFAIAGTADRSRAAVAASRDDLSELSRRELEVLALIAEGLTNDKIAERLYLSHRTVERHLSNVYAKLRLSGKAARAAAAARFACMPPRPEVGYWPGWQRRTAPVRSPA